MKPIPPEESNLPEEFKRLLVRPLEIYDGERGMVLLCKLRRKIDTLVKQHNKLVVRVSSESRSNKGRPALLSEEKPMASGELQSNTRCSPPSDSRMVVEFLIQLRYTCQCVAPAVKWLQLPTWKHLWCGDCNRPYLEKED